MTGLRFIWTERAVSRFLKHGTYDPRHTVSNMEIDLDSPWLGRDMMRRANGSAWILVDSHGLIQADWGSA